MSNEINKRVERIRAFFKKVQPQNHPIKDHPVAGCDEYVKGIYFDMLCVIAMYENDDAENQNRFIHRLMAGSGDTLTITDHIKRAMEITTEKMSEFITQVQSNNLVNIFFIDSLIISCANGLPNRKQTEFLAELGDTLGLNKASIQFCSELAVGILEQDFDKIKDSVSRYKNVETIVESADCYIMPIAKTVSNTDIALLPNKIHFYSSVISDTAFKTEEREFNNRDSVIMENLRFDDYINFNSIKEVKLVGCIFENISGETALYFSGVQKVNIKNCIFKNLEEGALWFFSSDIRVTISKSYFSDCSRPSSNYSSERSRGGIISSHERTNVTFEKCVFKNIYTKDHYGIISYGNDVIANNCEFYNCKQGERLFGNGKFSGENNTYTDCTRVT